MAQQFENWRILPDLHREIGVAAKRQGVPMYELARLAWDAYISRDRPQLAHPSVDPSITPRTSEERLLVAGLLLMLRDKRSKTACDNKGILGILIKEWIEKAKLLLHNERSA